MRIYYLFEEAADNDIAQAIKDKLGKAPLKREFRKNFTDFEEESLLIVDAADDSLAQWLYAMRNKKATILLLPNPYNPLAQAHYAIPKDPLKALEFLEKAHVCDHIIAVNDEVLLERLILGDASWLEGTDRWRITFSMIKNLFRLRLFPITIKTVQKEIKTAAFVIEAGDEAVMHRAHPNYLKDSPNLCERVTLLLYAPQSILQALKMRFGKSQGVPKGVGVIKTKSLTLQSPSDLSLAYNGKKSLGRDLQIHRLSTRYDLLTGWRECHSAELRESLRIENLPDEEMAQFFAKRPLPLFPVASEEAFAELFTKIRSSAKLTPTYLFLFVISVLMATVGLFQDSAPTIIGAMILAPLMGPVVAFAMGVVRFDSQILKNSLRTILFSLGLGLTLSALLAILLPFSHETQQMSIRTHPTLLDLAVAILSGFAAAYGYANTKVGESLAGVAIAVALVPPLCVAGIGLGWSEWAMFYNALLLVLANIIGIIFAAGVMFYILGFASKRYVAAAFFLKIALLLSIAFPLVVSTKSMIEDERIYATLRSRLTPQSFEIEKITHHDGKTFVYVMVDADELPKLQGIGGEKVVFVVTPRRRIE
ncbi:MAG: TIGR00341 family protein [Epsilonproteobacteria bacterium]|nr:TIGR00341 family protein [Campylobacterota bacterium]